MAFVLGFTGTQLGMTKKQQRTLKRKLVQWSSVYSELEIHHGDCIGADEQFHNICIDYWPHSLKIVIHPPLKDSKRAFCSYTGKLEVKEPKDYLLRNHDIVDASDHMVAAPKTLTEELRSGTWATIRYSRKINKPGSILKPE